VERRALRLVEGLSAVLPLAGATSLEVGAGRGGNSLTRHARGVARAATIDASPAAARTARSLAAERGVSERLEVEVGDFAARRTEERYDVVILDRVVCCYPDWRALLEPAAAAARGALALSYPREIWYMWVFRVLLNAGMKLFRKNFRFYVHPPAAMEDLLARAGLEPRVERREGPWELVVAVRDST
jgi:magnesium-protoporphyrin O-methyltransferase